MAKKTGTLVHHLTESSHSLNKGLHDSDLSDHIRSDDDIVPWCGAKPGQPELRNALHERRAQR